MKRFLCAIALFVSLMFLGGCGTFGFGREQQRPEKPEMSREERRAITNEAWMTDLVRRVTALECEIAELKKLDAVRGELARALSERIDGIERNALNVYDQRLSEYEQAEVRLRELIFNHDAELAKIQHRLYEIERRYAVSPRAGEPVPPTAVMSDKGRLAEEERLLSDLAAAVVSRRLCVVKVLRCEDEIDAFCEEYKKQTDPETRKGLMEKIANLEVAKRKIRDEEIALDAEIANLHKRLEELKTPPAKSEKG